MTSFHAVVALLQVIAAFMIFLASYLALFVFVILCLSTAVFIYKGADFLWAYTVKSDPRQDKDSFESKNNAGGSPETRQRIHHAFPGVSLFHSQRPR
jgi:hypothetical protein